MLADKERTLVLDNGAGNIKAALIPASNNESVTVRELHIPNALSRPGKTALSYPASKLGSSRRPHGMLAGAEMWDAPDFGGMAVRRAHERGILTSFDVQRDVWLSLMSNDRGFGLSASQRRKTALILTESIGAPMYTRAATDELVFEEFGFGACSVMPASRLVAQGGTALVLDAGFSATTAIPVVNGWELTNCARRLNLGGKALTNQLKTTVSYRSWNMMDEPVVMNAVKERLCYVSLNFNAELKRCQMGKELSRDYILPDTSTIGMDPLGHVRATDEELEGGEQVLVMNNERISVPELLFTPSDAGISQAGVAELISQAINACPKSSHPALSSNVILVGGNCRFANFRQRLVSELRPLINEFFDLNVTVPDDPINAAMRSAVQLIQDDVEAKPFRMVTKQQYEEEGSRRIASKFFCSDDDPGDEEVEMVDETDSDC